jgi:hypothetical protein
MSIASLGDIDRVIAEDAFDLDVRVTGVRGDTSFQESWPSEGGVNVRDSQPPPRRVNSAQS